VLSNIPGQLCEQEFQEFLKTHSRHISAMDRKMGGSRLENIFRLLELTSTFGKYSQRVSSQVGESCSNQSCTISLRVSHVVSELFLMNRINGLRVIFTSSRTYIGRQAPAVHRRWASTAVAEGPAVTETNRKLPQAVYNSRIQVYSTRRC
jgi:hypothetical protein